MTTIQVMCDNHQVDIHTGKSNNREGITTKMSASFAMPADYQLTDDLDITNTAEADVDPALPLPLTVGNYQFRIDPEGSGLKKDKDGELVLVKNASGVPTYPVIQIRAAFLVGGEGYENLDGRRVFLFQEFDVKPRTERDFNTGLERIVNNLQKLLRSHDYTIDFESRNAGLEALAGLVEQKGTFAARFDWVADDWRTRKTMLDAAPKVNGKIPDDVRNTIYEQTKREGMKKFQNPATRTYDSFFTSVSGEDIEARAQIKAFNGVGGFISSKRHDKTKFGPSITLGA